MKTTEIMVSKGHMGGLTSLNRVLEDSGYGECTEVDYETSVARMIGTGYRNEIYVSKPHDLRIVVKRSAAIRGWGDLVEITKLSDTTNEKKAYAAQIRAACKAHKNLVPFEVGLAVGPEGVAILAALLKGPAGLSEDVIWELEECGISRRKNAIKQVLGEEAYEALGIGRMGQTNAYRVAHFVAKVF